MENVNYLVSIHRNIIVPLANIKFTEHREIHIQTTLKIMKNHNMRNNRLGLAVPIPCGAYEDRRNTFKIKLTFSLSSHEVLRLEKTKCNFLNKYLNN